MTKNKKILLNSIYLLLILLTICLYVINRIQYNIILFSIMITIFTTLFHFTIRYIFANFFYKMIEKKCTYDRSWFIEKVFEKKLFRIIRIKRWKLKLPTWNDDDFNLSETDFEKLMFNMCRAEVYHEICMILSFVPILFSILFGKFWVFYWTSIGGCLFDLLFVLIQRYNRPRVLKIYYAHKKKYQSKTEK